VLYPKLLNDSRHPVGDSPSRFESFRHRRATAI
jgi:hypothetical protein